MVQFSPSGKIAKGSESTISMGVSGGADAAGGTLGVGEVASMAALGEGETVVVEERLVDGLGVTVAAAALAAVGFS